MNPKMAGYLILHGGFLVLLGVMGLLAKPEKADPALLAFGALTAGVGVLGARGVWGSLLLALAALAAFIRGCAWETGRGWLAGIEGQAENLSPTLALGRVCACLLKTNSPLKQQNL